MPWQPLLHSLSENALLPPLLISKAFTSNSYVIYLTDLAQIWSESLEYHDILRRSQEQSTSIDPSDGDQLQILLEKINAGISGGDYATLALGLTPNTDCNITLNITVRLPGPLAPLKWPVYLAIAPQSLLTSHLTIPLLWAQCARIKQVSSLAEALTEKDLVIQKLLDKFEAQGTELGHVFPQAAGKGGRKLNREIAEKRVNGLKPFNMDSWRSGFQIDQSGDAAKLVADVFGKEGSSELRLNSTTDSILPTRNWWENLKVDNFEIRGLTKSSKSRTPPKAIKDEFKKPIDDNEDFQVQVTPPLLTSPSSKPAAAKSIIDDSTEDEDDIDVPSQGSKVLDSFPSSPRLPTHSANPIPKKLGVLGTKKKVPSPASPSDEGTAADYRQPPPLLEKHPERGFSPPASEVATSKPKRGLLGRVGGKKEAIMSPDIPPPVTSLPPPPPEAARRPRGKLGQIGGQKIVSRPTPSTHPESTAETSVPVVGNEAPAATAVGQDKSSVKVEDNGEMRGRSGIKPEENNEPQLRETSEERAKKKREQLKRELEQKAKVPAKKKRKF